MDAKKRRSDPIARFAIAFLQILYVLSFGPACWLVTRKVVPLSAVKAAYGPLVYVIGSSPHLSRLAYWYCDPAPTLYRSGPNFCFIPAGGPFYMLTAHEINERIRARKSQYPMNHDASADTDSP